jgi:hypothetical protein
MFFMILAASEAVFAFLISYFRSNLSSSSIGLILSYTNALLASLVLVLSPIVLWRVWNTWRSLSRWRRTFLRFALVTSVESVPFDATNPQQRLLDAIMAANPEYEHVLFQKSRASPELSPEIFRNVTITHKNKTATFDILIGHLPKNIGKSRATDTLLRPLAKISGVMTVLHRLSEIGISVGRIIEGKPSIQDYKKFADDLKLLTSYSDSRVTRAMLVSTEPADPEVIKYASERRNWPRVEFTRIPIDIVLQEEKGYQVVLAS